MSARTLAHELGRKLGRDAGDLAALHADVRRTLPRASDVETAWLYLAQAFAVLCVVEAARREWAEVQSEIDALDALQSAKRRAVQLIQSTAPDLAAGLAAGNLAMPLRPQARMRALHRAAEASAGDVAAQLQSLLQVLRSHGECLTSDDFRNLPPARAAGRHDETGLRDATVQALVAIHPRQRGAARWVLALRLAGCDRAADAEVVKVFQRDMRRRATAARPSSEREYLMVQWPRLIDELLSSVGAVA